MFRTTKLKQKEVIDIETGQRLGYVSDIEINERGGRIEAVIVPKHGPVFSGIFGGELVIPWENIVVIGKDLLLVRMGGVSGCLNEGSENEATDKV